MPGTSKFILKQGNPWDMCKIHDTRKFSRLTALEEKAKKKILDIDYVYTKYRVFIVFRLVMRSRTNQHPNKPTNQHIQGVFFTGALTFIFHY